jgi:hypothetical protein
LGETSANFHFLEEPSLAFSQEKRIPTSKIKATKRMINRFGRCKIIQIKKPSLALLPIKEKARDGF